MLSILKRIYIREYFFVLSSSNDQNAPDEKRGVCEALSATDCYNTLLKQCEYEQEGNGKEYIIFSIERL